MRPNTFYHTNRELGSACVSIRNKDVNISQPAIQYKAYVTPAQNYSTSSDPNPIVTWPSRFDPETGQLASQNLRRSFVFFFSCFRIEHTVKSTQIVFHSELDS